ncbi:hypothetical protein DV495_001370 [Geotrichum candidum]|nr:hypothetical protein DV454_003446 [Geotrichum candidum]KAF5113650.1 hypothetical protein DV452_003607 [Geotrichum candidum]KAF5132369.1 hypothetical protein DV495_001370 [Geotrichum candidum]KAI8135637.1 hypothetical protein DUD61_000694 [Geotrichum candidum]KAI9213297.1 hypothetical protein DS838_001789 [Geotrichum bryndzae]
MDAKLEFVTIKIWKVARQNNKITLELIKSIDDHHKKSVTTIATAAGSNVFVSGSADGHLTFWRINKVGEAEFAVEIVTDIDLGFMSLPLTSSMHVLPKSQTNELVIAVGTTSKFISIYTGTSETEFRLSNKLEGHGDWIRSLAFKSLDDGNLMLASGSQDRYIRIWTVQYDHEGTVIKEKNELEDDSDDEDDEDQLSNIIYKLETATPYSIKFDALIIGHDDWVYSLQWHPTEIKLMSASADSSVMLWIPDLTSGVWLCATRLGEISSKGASTATGSYGGIWYSTWIGSDNSNIVSLTNMGSWKHYTLDDISSTKENEIWNSKNGITGHVKSVTDIAWSPQGNYVLTTSLDKTTRLFAPYEGDWYELSRPQIHGYDMMCICPLNSGLFVSGGDEKILRVFKATKVIANLLNNLLGFTIDADSLDSEVATVPVLSLSNKAISSSAANQPESEDNDNDEDEYVGEDYTKHGLDITKPPLEDQLQRHTLWPEIEKIYGHGYEMVTLASSHDNKLLVSACKANTKDHAVIRTTDISNWQEASSPLSFHTLTITRLRFSFDDKLLLSVSRDRTWSVWARNGDLQLDQLTFGKGHSRIIWDCSWIETDENDEYYFATASRDKTVKIWRSTTVDGKITEFKDILSIPTLSTPATSIDIIKVGNNDYRMAVGLDTGDLITYKLELVSGEAKVHVLPENGNLIDKAITPAARVNRISWTNGVQGLQLAVASEDHSVRIYSF